MVSISSWGFCLATKLQKWSRNKWCPQGSKPTIKWTVIQGLGIQDFIFTGNWVTKMGSHEIESKMSPSQLARHNPGNCMFRAQCWVVVFAPQHKEFLLWRRSQLLIRIGDVLSITVVLSVTVSHRCWPWPLPWCIKGTGSSNTMDPDQLSCCSHDERSSTRKSRENQLGVGSSWNSFREFPCFSMSLWNKQVQHITPEKRMRTL